MEIMEALIDGLIDVPGIVLYGPLKPEIQVPILSVTFDAALPDGLHVSFGGCGGRTIPSAFESVHPHEAGSLLKESYDISIRVGLHCAPLAHQGPGNVS